VFDLSDRASFEKLKFWRDNFLETANPMDPVKFPFVVVGNKCDLERKVTEEEARQWC